MSVASIYMMNPHITTAAEQPPKHGAATANQNSFTEWIKRDKVCTLSQKSSAALLPLLPFKTVQFLMLVVPGYHSFICLLTLETVSDQIPRSLAEVRAYRKSPEGSWVLFHLTKEEGPERDRPNTGSRARCLW